MLQSVRTAAPALDTVKFTHPDRTAKGEERAVVALTQLRTLWFNTGSLCNITCKNCYMDSSPTNDNLAYITAAEVDAYLDEIAEAGWPVEEIAFTGGEPFMNGDLLTMLESSLSRGYRGLVLSNAMKPMQNKQTALRTIHDRYGDALTIRVSIDHYTPDHHEEIRGNNTWEPMIKGLTWLSQNGFRIAIAGRTLWNEDEDTARAGYTELFRQLEIPVDVDDPSQLVLFPEMDETLDVPEITTHCWDILGVRPESMMCSTSRMVIKRKGGDTPAVVPCTLLPYDAQFELGEKLSDGARSVKLNHPHCARFCVLGGASCSAG